LIATLAATAIGLDGQLGLANTRTIGDDEVPFAVGPVSAF
jgi:hypothetical protein